MSVRPPHSPLENTAAHRMEAHVKTVREILLMSLPATKGFEIGSGFAGARLRGSGHNDAFYMEAGRTATNRPAIFLRVSQPPEL